MRSLVLAVVVTLGSVCFATCGDEATSPDDLPWLADLIQRLESAPVRNPPASITEYRYRGERVYYVPPACCDIFSDLYDRDGHLICHPEGGIRGGGDGRCSDFAATRSGGRLIWRDKRPER